MFHKLTLTCAVAAAFGFAAFAAATTSASAARVSGALKPHHAASTFKTHHVGSALRTHHAGSSFKTRHVARTVSSLRVTGGTARCLEAECGQPPVAIDDTYVVRGCQGTPAGSPLPPWCEGATGVPLRTTRGFRR